MTLVGSMQWLPLLWNDKDEAEAFGLIDCPTLDELRGVDIDTPVIIRGESWGATTEVACHFYSTQQYRGFTVLEGEAHGDLIHGRIRLFFNADKEPFLVQRWFDR